MDIGPVNEKMPPMPSLFDIGLDDVSDPQQVVNFEYVRIENNTSFQTEARNFRVATSDQTAMYVPRSAHVAVRGRLVKRLGNSTTNLALSATDQAVLADNGFTPYIDSRLRLGDVEVGFHQFPGHVSHMRNLLESGRSYLETVGPNAHYYLTEVSDNHDPTTIEYTARRALGAAAVPAVVLANAEDLYEPKSLKDEHQVLLAPLAAAVGSAPNVINNFVMDSRKNPNFDKYFAEKHRRAMLGTLGGTEPYELLLPLRDLFPIMDRDKILRGTTIDLEMNINDSAAMVWGVAGANETIHFVIERFSLLIARVVPSLAALTRLEAQLVSKPVAEYDFENIRLYRQSFPNGINGASNNVYQIGNLQSRPTKCVIAFQYADRLSDQKLNPLQFDIINDSLTRLDLEINNKRVPYITYEPDKDWIRIVQELHRVGYKEGDIADSACIDYKNWKSVYPIAVFSLENVEGNPFEARNRAELKLNFSTKAAVDIPAFNIFALVYSQSKAYFDTSSGRTAIRVQ